MYRRRGSGIAGRTNMRSASLEKKYVDFFEQSHPTDLKCSVDQVCAVGHVSWNSGDWSFTLRGEIGPSSIKGYRLDILVREGNAWKEYISCYNMAQAPATPETKKTLIKTARVAFHCSVLSVPV
jgi:hypothetical protein